MHSLTKLLIKENPCNVPEISDKIIRQYFQERAEWLAGEGPFNSWTAKILIDEALGLSPSCKEEKKEPYKKDVDPKVTCWHCGKTFLCDCMDATCRLCGAPFDKRRCDEFNFTPKFPSVPMPEKYWEKCEHDFTSSHTVSMKQSKCRKCGFELKPSVPMPEKFQNSSYVGLMDVARKIQDVIDKLQDLEQRLSEVERDEK